MSRIKRKQKGLMNQKEAKTLSLGSKWITQGLLFSVMLNIALLTSLVFNVVKNKSISRNSSSHKRVESLSYKNVASTLKDVIVAHLDKTYLELISSLSDKEQIEDGFTVRDIALSILYQQFDLDLKRALLGQEINTRNLILDSPLLPNNELSLISGLTETEYKLIETFLQNEKWPLTSYGLFKKLSQGIKDESLKNTFYLSKEFMYIEALFCSYSISKEVLLSVVLQGNWETLNQFSKEYHGVQDFSNPLRIHFLSQYLEFGSELAARLILEVDAEYALKKLGDSQIVALISLLEQKSNLAENFALHLALGNRSDWVREEACRLLYFYSGQHLPTPYNYQEALNFISQKYKISPIETFAPAISSHPKEEEFMSLPEPKNIYVVQEGDNLWKIAKKHRVHLDQLKEVNHLDSDLIKVGMTLLIP